MLDKIIYSVPPWLAFAEAEMNQKEIKGYRNNERIVEYHKAAGMENEPDETSWCGSFLAWLMKKVHLPLPKNPQVARSWLRWGVPLTIPAFGCVIVLDIGQEDWQAHSGLYVGEDKKTFFVLGGNQGSKVDISKYEKKKLLGFRWY